MLQSMGSQIVGHNLVIEQQHKTGLNFLMNIQRLVEVIEIKIIIQL